LSRAATRRVSALLSQNHLPLHFGVAHQTLTTQSRQDGRKAAVNGDIDPTKRERADDDNTHRPRWRIPAILIVAVIGMLLWLLLK
jgi:hypothetical protein